MASSLIYGHNSCFASYSCNPRFKLNSNSGTSSSSSSSPFDRLGISFHFCSFSGLKTFFRNPSFRVQAMSTTQRNVAAPNNVAKFGHGPDHLLVLVHGILASPSDWTYVEAELKKRLGNNFLIHASSCNTYTKTFSGIDGAGRRLADEVMQVVQKTEGLRRISFLAHSLGGLFARYAIAVLYTSNGEPDDISTARKENSEKSTCSRKGLIAGLEPINFVTLATPHLGVRGKKQLPFLLGVPFLEKLAPPIAPILIGRTGHQLFLTDGKPSKPPLLLRMASDCEDGKFISALGAFRCRILYANVSYDRIQTLHQDAMVYFLAFYFKNSLGHFFVYHFLEHPSDMVGWRTSSIRRESELVKPPRRSLDGYKHVVDVEYCSPVSQPAPNFPLEAVKAKEAAQIEPTNQQRAEYHDILEEEMIHGLQRLGWRKVDVSFHSAFWPFFAHNNIHVKQEWLYNAGAGVIAHVADSLKQQESCTFMIASL